jgi:hypothetical protein
MSRVFRRVIKTRPLKGKQQLVEQVLECGHAVTLKGREAKDALLVARRKCTECKQQR